MSQPALYVSVGTPAFNALKALAARLYDKDGQLKSILQHIAKGLNVGTVALLMDELQRPYGTVVINHNGLMAAYVVPELRGQGWGSKLVSMAKACCTLPVEKLHARPGQDTTQSIAFWKRNRIPCQHDGSVFAMTTSEVMERLQQGRVLISRAADDLELSVIEALYITELYTNDYSDKHDGIRGHLACILGENYTPVDFILFHYTGEFVSCATVRDRTHRLKGVSREIVEVQLYVHERYRNQGLGQELIDKVKSLYPDRTLFGYHTDTSHRLLERNGILDLRRSC